MEVYQHQYTAEDIKKLNGKPSYVFLERITEPSPAYARSTPPLPPVSYTLLHPEVQVPSGFLPVQVAQFSELDPLNYNPRQYHWSILIPTSPWPGVGHYYELAGESPMYHAARTIDNFNVRRGYERGTHTIGYVLPAMLPSLEDHLSRVPISILTRFWTSQLWVWHALQGLNHPHMFTMRMPFEDMALQLAIASAAWQLRDLIAVESGRDSDLEGK